MSSVSSKKVRRRNILIALGCLVACAILGLSLVLPFFDDRSRYYIGQTGLQDKNKDDVGDWDNDSEAFHYFYPPGDGFGNINPVKTVNWSFFKEKFTKHTFWRLEYKRYEWNDWTNGNQYLTVNRTWNETGFWKINLTFTAPVDVYEARFIFACNLSVLDYVEKDDYEVWLNYSFNATENISLMFNWSDLNQYQNLYYQKGVQNGKFYFLFGKQNIPAGEYVFDPSFGHTGAGGSYQATAYDIRGTVFTMGATGGTADNISVYIRDNNAGNISAGIYLNSTKAQVAYCEEAEETVPPSSTGWRTLDVVSGGTLLANTEYALGFWNNGSGMRFYYDSDANYSFHDNCNKLVYSDFIAVDPVTYDSTSSQTYSIYCSYTESGGDQRQPFQVFNNWFSCGNGSLRNPVQVFNNWFDCGNVTVRNPFEVFNYWWSCGNVTLREPFEVFNYWFDCGNITIRNPTQVFNNWFDCGNITVRQPINVFNNWFLCGNVTQRNPVQVFNYWWDCGNVSDEVRNPYMVFNNWFSCGNGSVRNPYQVFNNWWLCGNGTARTTIQIFNNWFSCGNVTPQIFFISNLFPSNNSMNIPIQPVMYLTINHTSGQIMNISWYYGPLGNENILLGIDTNFSNSTQFEQNWNASVRATDYYWRIQIDDGINYENYSYTFMTEGYGGGHIITSPYVAIAFGAIALIIGIIVFLFIRRRKS